MRALPPRMHDSGDPELGLMFAQYDPSTATPEEPRGVKQFYACGGVLSSAVTLMREKLDPKQPWDIQVRTPLHGTARHAGRRRPSSQRLDHSSLVTCPPRAWWVHGSCRRRRRRHCSSCCCCCAA